MRQVCSSVKPRRFPKAPLIICRVVRALLALANISALIILSTGKGADHPQEKILSLVAYGTFLSYNSLKVLSSIRSTGAPESNIIPLDFH